MTSQSMLLYNLKGFLLAENPELMIKTAEEIGTYLGISNAEGAIDIYHLMEPIVKQVYRNSEDSSKLFLLKPKIANIIAIKGRIGKPSLEIFHQVILEGMKLINDQRNKDKSFILRRFIEFIDAIISYYYYARKGGLGKIETPELINFQNEIFKLQAEIDKLSQFVSTATDKIKVFLSHSHDDKDFVKKLNEELEKNNIRTWYDDKDMDIGDILSVAISEGIKQSWCFLIVVSQNALKSGWIEYELNEAYHDHITLKKKILPVLYGDISDEQIPERLKKHLYADFRKEDNFDESFTKLYRAIVREGSKIEK